MILGIDATVIAHLDQSGVVRIGIHPVLPFELLDDPLNGRSHAEWFAAIDAFEGFFGVQNAVGERVF